MGSVDCGGGREGKRIDGERKKFPIVAVVLVEQKIEK